MPWSGGFTPESHSLRWLGRGQSQLLVSLAADWIGSASGMEWGAVSSTRVHVIHPSLSLAPSKGPGLDWPLKGSLEVSACHQYVCSLDCPTLDAVASPACHCFPAVISVWLCGFELLFRTPPTSHMVLEVPAGNVVRFPRTLFQVQLLPALWGQGWGAACPPLQLRMAWPFL